MKWRQAMSKTQIITQKVVLYPMGNKDEVSRVYTYIRDGMYNQNKAYNILISSVYSAIYTGKSKEEITELYRLGSRIPTSKKGSLYDPEQIKFPKGLATSAAVGQQVRNDLAIASSRGLFKGNVSLNNRKLRDPLIIPKQQFSFWHDCVDNDDFIERIEKGDTPDVYMKFVNGIQFKVVFGNPKRSRNLALLFKNLFANKYEKCGSSLQFDKTGKKIILNLSVKVPVKSIDLDDTVVVGVRFANDEPIVCSTNQKDSKPEYIGNAQVLVDEKTKIQSMRRRCQARMRYTSGGHGRDKKMHQYKFIKEKERNFAKAYNHVLSHRIVEYAKKQGAKYINIEDMSALYHKDEFVLKNYNYYQLYTFISYKASMYGIEMRLVDRIPNCEMAEDKSDDDYAKIVANMTEVRKFTKSSKDNS